MTLVELMVTMVIASIVAASTFMFFAGQQRVYETQTKMLNVQQNVWASMEVLSRFVRTAGSGMYGCVRPVGGIVASPPLNRSPTGPDPDDSDDPPVVAGVHDFSKRPNAGLRAYNSPGMATYDPTTGQMQRVPPLWIVDQVDPNQPSGTAIGIVSGTDSITVAFGNRSSGTNFDSPLAGDVTSTNGAIVALPGNSVMFQPGEFILLMGEPGMGGVGFGLASDVGCTLFQTTSVTTATDTLNHANDDSDTCAPPPSTECTGSIWNPLVTVAAMIPGSGYHRYLAGPPVQYANTGIRNFGEFWWVRFAIRTLAEDGTPLTNLGIAGQTHDVPVLTMERLDGSPTSSGPQVLAEGIEDLQVAFACDLNADGVLTATANQATDEWKLDNPADVIATSNAAKCNQPSAVRLTLVARSLTEDNGIDAALTDNGRPAVENHPGHTPDNNFTTGRDQFRRRVMTTTVYPRNN
jgi:type II secretory pathway pseudopilin PulG